MTDFQSNYARGKEPPPFPAPMDNPLVMVDYYGISTFDSLATLKQRLSWVRWVAALELPSDIALARTFASPGHWTVWAAPERLFYLARIMPV